MSHRLRTTAAALVALLGLTVAAPQAAHAGSKGRRNTAIALGAVAIYGATKKNALLTGLGAGGAIYSYMKSREALKKERARAAAERAWELRERRARLASLRSGRYASSRTAGYRSSTSGPSGWSRGRKTGWRGSSVPPGHARKAH